MMDPPSQELMFGVLSLIGGIVSAAYWALIVRFSRYKRLRTRAYWGFAAVVFSACVSCAVYITVRYPLAAETGSVSGAGNLSWRGFEWYLWTAHERQLELNYLVNERVLYVRSQEHGSFRYAMVPVGAVHRLCRSHAPIVFYERHIKGHYEEQKTPYPY